MLILALVTPSAVGFAQNKDASRGELFDPVEFIKGFRIGMSYDEVQALLPKTAEQDALAYIIGEEAFLLGVDITGRPAWNRMPSTISSRTSRSAPSRGRARTATSA